MGGILNGYIDSDKHSDGGAFPETGLATDQTIDTERHTPAGVNLQIAVKAERYLNITEKLGSGCRYPHPPIRTGDTAAVGGLER